jgi:hypothetical protein
MTKDYGLARGAGIGSGVSGCWRPGVVPVALLSQRIEQMDQTTGRRRERLPVASQGDAIMRNVRLSQQEARQVKHLMRQPRPCLLCGGLPVVMQGIFVPDTPELWGGTPGKVRLLGYALCRSCQALPDRTFRVEARIMAGLVGRGN